MSPREFHGGFAMGILMDGVMGCRTYCGFMQIFCWFLSVFMMVFWCLRVGFHGPPLPTQPSGRPLPLGPKSGLAVVVQCGCTPS